MLEGFFILCVGLMMGMAGLFHLSYMTINVILFCFVEPIFTGTMITLAFLSLCGLSTNMVGIWIFRIVVGLVILVFIASAIYLLYKGATFSLSINTVPHIEVKTMTSPYCEGLFHDTVQWLTCLAHRFGTTYEIINIALYVVLMPVLSIASYVLLRIRN